MVLTTIFYFVGGLVCLLLGADALVKGASRLAAAVGVSSLVIGLTVVAFGTSAPELAVSVQSAIAGQADIALGNVIGSNVFNVLFILGLSAIIVPLIVAQQLVRFDVPLMIVLSILTFVISWDGVISRTDGILFIAGLLSYVVYTIYQSRKETAAIKAEYEGEFGVPEEEKHHWLKNVAFVVAGLGLLVLGSHWFVKAAVTVAEALGVSKVVIGITIVAIGTSLPEVVTSVVAAVRGERDIAVGNVVGSNIFNIMGVLGFAGALSPAGVQVAPQILYFDIPVMIAVAVVCMPIFFSNGVISRTEGFVLFSYYIAYTTYIVLVTIKHPALATFNNAILYFMMPLTGITILAIFAQHFRKPTTPTPQA